ncbi:MAG: hypothetical protein JKY56_06195 [Kofleriaceae bacterium]|nr:hypothetical protein [Kofleriaceae bacterium]
MGQLQQHEQDGESQCVECQKRLAVGPCAACHGMVCGDCCTLVTDPSGKRVICLSCTRMVAGVSRKPLTRNTGTRSMTAWVLLAIFAIGILAVLRA